MSDDLRQEVDALKRMLASCAERVGALEQRLRGGATAAVSAPPAPKPPVAAHPPVQTPRIPSAPPAPRWRNLEATIGRDWFNKIGIVTLVLGVVFFILYTFQYLGPAMKIALGFAIGGGMLGVGVWLERRPGMRWYALGPIGGGWALLYFTTYAMHHIPAVRLLQSPLLDLCLLGVVATGAVWHSLKYRSEYVTAVALLLGFITVTVAQVTTFTLLATVLLVTALCWLVMRLRWHQLYLFGVLASYATYLFWIRPQIDASRIAAGMFANVAEAQFWLKMGFLALYWLAYQCALLTLNEQRPVRRQALLAATLVNALGFTQLVLLTMDPLYHDLRYLFLLATGGVYVLSSPVARRRGLPTIESTHLLLGLTMAAVAVPLKFTGHWVNIWWTLAVPFFAWLGLRYARWPYRAFAAGLAVAVLGRWLVWDIVNASAVVFPAWFITWRLAVGCLAAASFVAAGWCYRLPRFRDVLWLHERHAFRAYVIAAAVILWTLIYKEVSTPWITASWTATATSLVLAGWWLRDRVLRLSGLIGAAFAWVVAISAVAWAWWGFGNQAWWHWASAVRVVALWCACNALLRIKRTGERFTFERWYPDVCTIAAVLLLTRLLGVEVAKRWLSVAWAVEGAVVLALGFGVRDRVLRISGLSLLGLLVFKILFVDLAGAETVYRILSFIVAGLVLLVASYAYTRFSSRLTSSTASTDA